MLTRLRIGHSLMTHGHLMERRHQPYCDDCLVPLTIKHVISECPTYSDNRLDLFPQTEGMDMDKIMKEILAEKQGVAFNLGPLVDFIEKCDMKFRI